MLNINIFVLFLLFFSEMDMFDLSPRCGWIQSKKGILNRCDTLLAISSVKEKCFAISLHSDQLLGHVYTLDIFCCLFLVTLLEASVERVIINF